MSHGAVRDERARRAPEASFASNAPFGRSTVNPCATLYALHSISSPFDGLVVIATPERQFSPSKNDDDITLRRTVVSSYANLRGVHCDHLPDLCL